MKQKIYYVTGNEKKFRNAQNLMRSFGLVIEQAKLDLPEIQSTSFEEIALDKAAKAFEILKKPLFVNDAGWLITALNGFPGPFMKFINNCFSPEDFLALMANHNNKEVILRDTIVYVDTLKKKIFSFDNKGVMLTEVKGNNGPSSTRVMSLSSSGKSISEETELGSLYLESEKRLWEDFATWLKTK